MNERKKIHELIENKGVKKVYVAKELGIRPETLSRKIKNPETFNAVEMSKLSKILQVKIDDLDFNVIFFTPERELNSSFNPKQTA